MISARRLKQPATAQRRRPILPTTSDALPRGARPIPPGPSSTRRPARTGSTAASRRRSRRRRHYRSQRGTTMDSAGQNADRGHRQGKAGELADPRGGAGSSPMGGGKEAARLLGFVRQLRSRAGLNGTFYFICLVPMPHFSQESQAKAERPPVQRGGLGGGSAEIPCGRSKFILQLSLKSCRKGHGRRPSTMCGTSAGAAVTGYNATSRGRSRKSRHAAGPEGASIEKADAVRMSGRFPPVTYFPACHSDSCTQVALDKNADLQMTFVVATWCLGVSARAFATAGR